MASAGAAPTRAAAADERAALAKSSSRWCALLVVSSAAADTTAPEAEAGRERGWGGAAAVAAADPLPPPAVPLPPPPPSLASRRRDELALGTRGRALALAAALAPGPEARRREIILSFGVSAFRFFLGLLLKKSVGPSRDFSSCARAEDLQHECPKAVKAVPEASPSALGCVLGVRGAAPSRRKEGGG